MHIRSVPRALVGGLVAAWLLASLAFVATDESIHGTCGPAFARHVAGDPITECWDRDYWPRFERVEVQLDSRW